MSSALKRFRRRAFARPEVKVAYDGLARRVRFFGSRYSGFGSNRPRSSQEVLSTSGTTQSAIARLESATRKHSPSIATLQKYADALGYRVEVRLVKQRRLARRSTGRADS